MAGINIREIAADTLVEILEHGQFSHIYLKAVLDKYGYLEKTERAFLNRLVNGVVERKIELDYIIDNYSKTKAKKMKPFIRTIMRMGVFEIYYMDSVPDSATCNEYVKLAKKRSFAGLSGFVNGVLRSIARGKGQISTEDLSIKYSMPQWIVDKWTKDYGKEVTAQILEEFFTEEKLCIRVNRKLDEVELAKRLANNGITYEKSDLPHAGYISGYDSVASIPEFNEGLFYVQDYSSQLVAHVAQAKPADNVIDVCAAPGGKALHFAEILTDGQVLARDLTDVKIGLINENIARVGAKNVAAEKWDATVLDEDSIRKYDIVIADLPCSGLGIIRKKPDIKYNQTEESLTELSKLQSQILDNVCQYVKEAGTLCYSTCTINKDENENQVEAFLTRHPEFKVQEMKQLFPDSKHDGFFICVMRKN
ncbi:16S rRNA (cytosine(967)-C(5))-methyltransferase RsmB [Pseudobutyrivibrio xylanivorans]|uniref:16S rRNA (cytosine(967)-C(5))-methyltransferase n=1 Tax=Pseudobutyrivibrio xylanivorans TaxID=185007 RepID=A0A5P6VS41_PSEXY|nr:16S rRNA (cytosine(967)-C(5))-methyltransferase RsmB [Pseudobutyrivibrio xylanivorans]QFJ53661.1 16S rRNA (cytosine(967)-C(5))-methyltransferase RsmB [Pseudobutyrivibrio xylanivorans]